MKKLIIVFTCIISHPLWAQTEPSLRTFEIEVDPIAYIFKGYSFHAIYQPGRLRFDVGLFGIRIPEEYHGNPGFEVKTQGVGFKAHYLIQGTGGLYAGIGSGYTTTEAEHQAAGTTDKGKTIGFGPEVGYRFFIRKPKGGIQKGFYIAPWVGFSYNVHTDKIRFPDVNYKQQTWQFFPTVHIGYRL